MMATNIKLILGDCLTVMRTMADKSVDLTITSPPYDNLRIYGGHIFNFEQIAKELFRLTKNNGVVVWVVGDQTIGGSETGTSFRQALFFKELGFNLHDTMIWYKHSPPLTHNRYEQHFEFMFIFSKGKPKTFNPLKEQKIWKDNRKFKNVRREKDGSYDMGFIGKQEDKIMGNVWQIPVGGGHCTNNKIAHQHPAIFPEDLAKKHILSWSNKGDTVLDPMMGSGTVAKMAKITGRNFIGIEIHKPYFDIAEQRIKNTVEEMF